MSEPPTISVSPALLRWAATRGMLSPDVLIRQFPSWQRWLDATSSPTLAELERLARISRTPLGYLFLSQPPSNVPPSLQPASLNTDALTKEDLMTTVENRIQKNDLTTFIQLTELEKDIYSGTGWKLAEFRKGILVGFFDPELVRWQEDAEAMADDAINQAVKWLGGIEGEAWLVMCSGYQLNQLRRIDPTSASDIAHMARIFGEQAAS